MQFDLIIVGAGLASALTAIRLSRLPNPPSILILEKSATPFEGRTWSFHEADLVPEDRQWVEPLADHRWANQAVRFPDYSRRLDTGYASLRSETVGRFVSELPNVEVRAGQDVVKIEHDRIRLSGGETLSAGCVIDASGFKPDPALTLGYQKFLGLEVETSEPHGLGEPVIMDATVPQLEGYRFVYCLPFGPRHLLIEDTRYSDVPDIDAAALEKAIGDYASMRGWSVNSVLRREQGSLPIALAFDTQDFWRRRPRDVAQIGLNAALFHPTTGYSLPEAVAVANIIAGAWPTGSAVMADRVRDYALKRAGEQKFYRLLNRMLFRAAEPNRRHLVLQRFYRLPEPLIQRFYAGRTTRKDMLRILTGKPPVPILKALACFSEARFLKQTERQS